MRRLFLFLCAIAIYTPALAVGQTTHQPTIPTPKVAPNQAIRALLAMRHDHPTLKQLQQASKTPKQDLEYIVKHGPHRMRAMYLLTRHYPQTNQSTLRAVVKTHGAKSVLGRAALRLSGQYYGKSTWLMNHLKHKSSRVRRSVYEGLLISNAQSINVAHEPDKALRQWLKQALRTQQPRQGR